MSNPAPATIKPLIPPIKNRLTNDTESHKSSESRVVPLLIDTNHPQILIVDGKAIIIVIVIKTVLALLSIPTRYIW